MHTVSYKIFKKLTQGCKSLHLLLSFFTLVISICTYAQQSALSTIFLRQIDSLTNMGIRPDETRMETNRQMPFLKYNTKNKKLSYVNAMPAVNKPLSTASCNDTSGRFSINKDSVELYVQNTCVTKDGNLLIVGEIRDVHNPVYILKGMLIKTDFNGNILWSKLFDSTNHSQNTYVAYSHVLELKDGSIIIAGSSSDLPSGNDDLLITKTDASGNIIWTKDMYSRLWANSYNDAHHYFIFQLKEDPVTGEVYIQGNTWSDGSFIIKLDGTNGNILWSNNYRPPGNAFTILSGAGIIIRPNEIVSFASRLDPEPGILIYRINKINGDTTQTKALTLLDIPLTSLAFYINNPVTSMDDGSYAFTGMLAGAIAYGYNGIVPLYQAGVIKLDTDFNFLKGYVFRNKISCENLLKFTLYPNGSGLLAMHPMNGNYSGETYYTQFKDDVILKERRRQYSNERFSGINESIRIKDGADLAVQTVGDSIITNGKKIIFTKLHLSDTSSICLGDETRVTFIEPLRYGNPAFAPLDSIKKNIFIQREIKKITAEAVVLNAPVSICYQTSICDTLKLSASADSICPQTPVVIKVHKNPQCASLVQFDFDTTAVQSFQQLTDSTYQLIFKSAWQGYIKGSLPGCDIHRDSFLMTVLQAPSLLQLGADTSICPGNQLVLNAHKGYGSYRWQNGSTDSVFIVTQPGTYFVTITSPCGGQFSDTVLVTAHQPIAFSLGNDISICNKDTATIIAPTGFINYQWSPSYNISQTNGSSVNVSPATDTYYSVKAEKTPGCFAYDTIKINVKTQPLIQLGPDKSFCSGDSAILNAGNAFSQYQWNNGNVTQQIYVSTKGNYSVIGITADGCKSYDTLSIVNVWSNPIVHLDQNPNLCIGSTRTLQPGNYSSYIWQDGSVLPSFTISAPGNYYVTVTDNHQCQGSDTVRIATLHSTPSKFLPPDTAVCAYGKLMLATNQAFASYLWSNGEISASILITQPGLYWMQATDQYSCTGKDSVTVLSKECAVGLYVPTAFSPNKDGKNDVFKPLVLGNVIQFEWSIYNRYGQIIFTTHDPAKGWDGTVKGVLQNSAGFVWQCRYQLEGEKMKFKSGAVVLVR